MHEEINGNNMRITRGIYIEDTLYVIQGNIIEAYSLKDFKKWTISFCNIFVTKSRMFLTIRLVYDKLVSVELSKNLR